MEGRPNFRFMDLDIWQDATAIGATLFDVADKLESKRLYRFAEQLRGSGLSLSNNAGLGIARNAIFPTLSILLAARL
jgi:hypothetical protein